MEAKPEKQVNANNEIKISKKVFISSIIGVVVIAAIVLGLIFFKPFESGSGPVTANSGSVVAKVNGKSIYQSDVDKLKQSMQTQSPIPLEDSAITEQLVVKELLFQEAEKEGIKVTKQEAEKEINRILVKNGFAIEDFKKQLESAQTDYDTALNDFKEQLKIQKLIESHVKIKNVTDAEARAYYEQNKAVLFQGATAPPAYETIAEQLKQYIQSQDSQPKILAYVQSLKQTANIEML